MESVDCYYRLIVAALGLIVGGWFVPGGENQAMTFFGGGALLLTACLAGTAAWMARRPPRPRRRRRLVGRGPTRRPQRRPPSGAQPADGGTAGVGRVPDRLRRGVPPAGRDGGNDPNGPAGGFALVAESDLPIVQDLKSEKGIGELSDNLRRQFQRKYSGQELEAESR